MDGNRRYAAERGLPQGAGHEAGLQVFEQVITWLQEQHIPHGVFYAFSTENWHRSEAEVSLLLSLIEIALAKQRSVRLRFIGDRLRFSTIMQDKLSAVEAEEHGNTNVTIWVALSYGGRQEIISAVNKAIAARVPVTENSFSALFDSVGMPDPDLIIRTGGDMRLSNFLPWQAVYSELMFTPTYWPAFTKEEFTSMLAQYGDRKRRFGR
ncbi:MAG: hypothetical protein RLZZ360_176 [Candidatus Parcubacteria bacterium]|jgi:undecaprenyl diphosphate synthase